MTVEPRALRFVAFGLMLFYAVLGTAFIVGSTMMDPGGDPAIVLSACWFVPMIVLAVYALRRPETATRVLTVVAALVAVFVVLDEVYAIVPSDEIGPVAAISVFAVAVALGSLGLHRPARAGRLLLLVGAASLVSVFAKLLESEAGQPDAALGGSSAAAAIPALIIGGLFLLAASRKPRPDGEAPHGTGFGGSGRLGPLNPPWARRGSQVRIGSDSRAACRWCHRAYAPTHDTAMTSVAATWRSRV